MFKQSILAALAVFALSEAQTTTTPITTTSSRATTTRTSISTGPLAAYAYGGQLAYLQGLTTDRAYTSATAALANYEALPAYTRLSIAIAIPQLAIFTGTNVDAKVSSILTQLPSDIASVQKSVIDKAHSIASYYQTGTTPIPGIGLGIFNGAVATNAAGDAAASASQDAAISSILASLTASLTTTTTGGTAMTSVSASGLTTSRVGSSSSSASTSSASATATRNAAVGSGMAADRTWIGAVMAGGLGGLGVALL